MNRQTLKDNSELLGYLNQLANKLRNLSRIDLAEEVERASLFANGSASEFLHETQEALEVVSVAKPEGIELPEVQSVINQIKEAFRRIGGA